MREGEDYNKYLAIGLVFTVLILVGLSVYGLLEPQRLARAQESITQERIERGREVYQEQCASCHGIQGEGGVGPALNNRVLLKNTFDNAFFSVIRSGVPNTQMPAWGIEFGGPLTDEDIRDLVAFIRDYEDTAPEILPETFTPDPARGALLFVSTCAICHGENGLGSENAPRLNDISRLNKFPDEWYRDVIRNGRPAKGMPTWGTVLSPNQVADLVSLISAWREGRTVRAEFSLDQTLDLAVFSLRNDDTASAALHLQHALEAAEGINKEQLRTIIAKLVAEDLSGALDDLEKLRAGSEKADPAAGAALYNVQCAACHGVQGEGGIGKSLQANAFILEQPDDNILDLILHGRAETAMTGFQGRLTEREIRDIIALLRLWNP